LALGEWSWGARARIEGRIIAKARAIIVIFIVGIVIEFFVGVTSEICVRVIGTQQRSTFLGGSQGVLSRNAFREHWSF
jgi:hypothetical protein